LKSHHIPDRAIKLLTLFIDHSTLLDTDFQTFLSLPFKAGIGQAMLADLTGALQDRLGLRGASGASIGTSASTSAAAELNRRQEFLVSVLLLLLLLLLVMLLNLGAQPFLSNLQLAVNNLQQSHEYTLRFVETVSRDSHARFPGDKHKIESCISSLTDAASQLDRLTKVCDALLTFLVLIENQRRPGVQWGLERLVADDVSPRISPFADEILSSSYVLCEDDLASFDASSTFMATFINHLGDIFRDLKVCCSCVYELPTGFPSWLEVLLGASI
jgi:hypothetical protein